MEKRKDVRRAAPDRRMTVREKLELHKQIAERNAERRAEFKARKK